jgi:hypothetical protein
MPILATKGAGSAQGFGFSGGPGSSIFICATGGTVTTSGNFKIHTFTGPGSFVVNKKPQVANATVDYLVVAGGGGGSVWSGAGAGGFREGKSSPAPSYTASPLVAPAGIPVTFGSYPITVGAGGAVGPSPGRGGNPSIFSTITSAGGAAGSDEALTNGLSGGSGSGAAQTGSGGSGNTPPTSPPQGNSGSPNGGNAAGGGGGGATAAASGRPGGAGATTSITASPVTYAGGGAGSDRTGSQYPGGSGGGGNSGAYPYPGPQNIGQAGTINTLGGSGGGSDAPGGSGGSGIVVIRYQYQ